jgi:uncharacterized protein RhaS with RHS repeats
MPEVTWYGWDGDRLTTTQTEVNRIQTLYLPGSFTPLLRIETKMTELAQAGYRTLAQKLQQDAGVTFAPVLVTMLDALEEELRCGEISAANQQWLAQCGLTAEQMARQLEPVYTPLRKLHLYHCDHRGLPLALIRHDGVSRGRRSTTHGVTCCGRITRRVWNSLSACRASSTMQRRGCIITGTGITTRRREGISRRIQLG